MEQGKEILQKLDDATEWRREMKESMIFLSNTISNVSIKVDDVKEEISLIKIQTTRTNGRVTALEAFKKGIWWIVGGFFTAALASFSIVLASYIIHHYK